MSDIIYGSCSLGLSGERLLRWRDHLLGAAEQQRIQDHLSDCATCRSWLAAFSQTRRQLRGITTPTGGAALWRDVQAGIAQRSLMPSLGRSFWGVAVAALVVVSLVLIFTRLLSGAHPSTPLAPTPTRSSLPLHWTQKSRPVPSLSSLAQAQFPVIANSNGDTAYECLTNVDNNGTYTPIIDVTHDGGSHWTQSPPLAPLDTSAQGTLTAGQCVVIIDDGDANIAIASLGTAEIFITFDGGASWQVLQHGPLYPILQFSTYQGATYRIRMTTARATLEVSRDGWQTWAPVDGAMSRAGEGVADFWIDPTTGEMLAAGQTPNSLGHMWQSDNGGISWTRLSPLPPFTTGSFVVRPPHNGRSWQICVISPTDIISSLPFNPICSDDGGHSWKTLAPLQKSGASYELLGIGDDGSVLVDTRQLSPSSITLYRLPPGATSWQSIGQTPESDFIAYSPNPGVFWSIQLTGPKSSGGKPDANGVYIADFP
jgi:photosystem II stability/assembly factor-like uncharacterized protein